MCDSNDNTTTDTDRARLLYGIGDTTCSLIHNRNFSLVAQDFPITEELPELGREFTYQPALSHYNPDETSRLDRLQGLHCLMVAALINFGKPEIYEGVLSLHDRKGVLVLVVDSRTEPNDVAVLCGAACSGWAALNECQVALALRNAGNRPRRKPVMAKAPPVKSQFVDDKVPHGLWWVTGKGFVEE